jgi:hypothetical protein
MGSSAATRGSAPASGLRHPLALFAIVLLVINDHVLKRLFPGVLTGKLSDVAGLLFFPLFLQALWEALQQRRGRVFAPSFRVLALSTLATAVVFTLVKTWTPANDSYRVGLAALQWPARCVLAASGSHALPGLAPVALDRDPTDLFALPALAVTLWAGRRRTG